MQIAMVGLGRMGANMVRRLIKGGHECVVYDHSQDAVQKLAAEGRHRGHLARRHVLETQDPACGLAHGTRRRGRRHHQGPERPSAEGRHHHRRGETPTTSTTCAAPRSFSGRDRLGRLRHQRRCLRARPRLLPDDWWRCSNQWSIWIPIFKCLAPGIGSIDRTPGREKVAKSTTAEDGYLHCGPRWRRSLRQDGAQRDRIRHDGGLCRGSEHPEACQCRQHQRDFRRGDCAPLRNPELLQV